MLWVNFQVNLTTTVFFLPEHDSLLEAPVVSYTVFNVSHHSVAVPRKCPTWRTALRSRKREGQEVELQIRLPSATQTIRAIVRHRNVFRHGFEFVQPLHGIVRNEAVTGGC